jgi:hypothetical protein
VSQKSKAPSTRPSHRAEQGANPLRDTRSASPRFSSSSARPNSSVQGSGGAPAASHLVVYAKNSRLRGAAHSEFGQKATIPLLQVRMEPSPQLLPQIGEFTAAYTRIRFHPRTAEKLALASYELIENAVSYGSISGDIVYSLVEADRYIEVCVANDASPGRLSNLRTRIDRIRVDPEQAFQDEMSRSVSGNGAKSALGLVRICHEAQMDLELDVNGNRVTMRARCAR